MCHNLSGLVPQGLAVPVHKVFNVWEVLALESFGNEAGGLVQDRLCFGKRLAKLTNVVSVDNNGMEAKGLKPLLVNLHVMLKRGRIRLSKTVDIDDGAQVIELVEASKVEGLPDVSFHRLSVTHQAVGTV